jgi:hypothetical protein
MSKTQIAILWGLAVVIVIVFAVLSQVISRPSQGMGPGQLVPDKVYNVAETDRSARKLYPLADQAARSWQADAQLVSATANWPFVELDHFSKPVAWTFQFYSPGTSKIYVLHVDGDQVGVLREALSPYPLAGIAVDNWQSDSHQALAAWLNDGGGRFLSRNSVVDVTARLRHSEEGQLLWVVVGAVRGEQEIQLSRVDAASGEIVQ